MAARTKRQGLLEESMERQSSVEGRSIPIKMSNGLHHTQLIVFHTLMIYFSGNGEGDIRHSIPLRINVVREL